MILGNDAHTEHHYCTGPRQRKEKMKGLMYRSHRVLKWR